MASKTMVRVDLDALKRIRTKAQEEANNLRIKWGEEESYLRELVEGNHAGEGNWWEGSDADKYRESLDEDFHETESDIKFLEAYCETLGQAVDGYTQLGEKIEGILNQQ